MDNTNITENVMVWDPFGDSVNSLSFSKQCQSLVNQLQKYRQDPGRLKKNLNIMMALPVLVLVILVIIFLTTSVFPSLMFLILGFLPLIIYHQYINKLQDELILYLICEKVISCFRNQ